MNNPFNVNVIETWFYLFFLLTPFCGLLLFLVLSSKMSSRERIKILFQVTTITLICSLFLYIFGRQALSKLSIDLNALRVGTGILLFLTGLKLIESKFSVDDEVFKNILVPLCIPVIIGPATTSALIVLSAENGLNQADFLAVVLACTSLGILLYLGRWLENTIGKNGIDVLSRLNGLYMIVIAAQMVLIGLRNSLQTVTNYAIN